jgi:hypothetical protein
MRALLSTLVECKSTGIVAADGPRSKPPSYLPLDGELQSGKLPTAQAAAAGFAVRLKIERDYTFFLRLRLDNSKGLGEASSPTRICYDASW